MALSYNKYFDTIPSSYKVIGAVPIDLRQVVDNLDNLYGAAALADHIWEDSSIGGNIIAYNGLLVSVKSNNSVYMCINYANPYTAESWKCISNDETTSVTSIQGSIRDYIALSVNSSKGDVVISADLSIGDISNDIDGLAQVSNINEYLNEKFATLEYVNSSILSIKEYIDASIDDIEEEIENLNNKINDISNKLDEGYVKSIISDSSFVNTNSSQGDVIINIDIIDASDNEEFSSSGLVTDGYVEEKLDRFNWIEFEDNQ